MDRGEVREYVERSQQLTETSPQISPRRKEKIKYPNGSIQYGDFLQ
jgi:hypothetical protein